MSRQVPVPPDIFVIWDGMGLVAKRIERVPHSDPPEVVLKSFNPEYYSYERLARKSASSAEPSGSPECCRARGDGALIPRCADSGEAAHRRLGYLDSDCFEHHGVLLYWQMDL